MMQTVVIVSPTPTHPIDFGNRKRVFRMASQLKARGFKVHFILYPLEQDWRADFPEAAYKEMQESWDEFHVVYPTVGFHRSPKDIDHELDEWWDPALERFLWWYMRSRSADALIVNYIYLSRALTLAPSRTLKILDTHDQFGGRRGMLEKLQIKPEFFHISHKDEAKGIARADVVVAIKPEEQSYFDALGAHASLTVPYSEPPKSVEAAKPDADAFLRVGMIGGRNSINRRSVDRFMERAIPAIYASCAPIKIVIGGTICHDLAGYSSKFCVELIGPVDDVADFYNRVDCVVVPMEVSSGQKIKVGEALGYGVPVLALRHAFEGYTPFHPSHTCDSLDQLIDAIIDLSFEQEHLAGLRKCSLLAAEAQELLVESSVDQLSARIRLQKPKCLLVVDRNRFESNPLLRLHLTHFVEFLSAVIGVIICFDGAENNQFSGANGREVLDRLRRDASILPPGSTVENILKDHDVIAIADYGRAPFETSRCGPDWYGMLLECSNFTSSLDDKSAAASYPQISPHTGQFVSWLGQASDLRTPKSERRAFPCKLYPKNMVDQIFKPQNQDSWRGLYIFASELHEIDLLCEIYKMAGDSKAIKSIFVFTQNDELAERLSAWLSANATGLKLNILNSENALPDALLVRPVMQIDLAPLKGFASNIRNAAMELNVPVFSRSSAIVENGLVIKSGASNVDLFLWTRRCLNALARGSLPPSNNFVSPAEAGYAALFNFLTNFADLHRGKRLEEELQNLEILPQKVR